jgi:amidase
LDNPKVYSLADLIQFNKDNGEQELPPGKRLSFCDVMNNTDQASEYPSQSILEHDLEVNLSDSDYEKYTTHFRHAGREGIDKVFRDYDLNIIIGPSDSDITVLAAASGK